MGEDNKSSLLTRIEDAAWQWTSLVKLVLYSMGIGVIFTLSKLLYHADQVMQVYLRFFGVQ